MYSLQGRRLFYSRMTQMLRDAARCVRSSLMSEREARAHGAQGRGFRHFAAVMVDAINDSLTESPAYCIADVLGMPGRERHKLHHPRLQQCHC